MPGLAKPAPAVDARWHEAFHDRDLRWDDGLEGDGRGSEHGDHLVDVAPFWAQRPAAITFTAGGHAAAFPAMACPTAPADRRP